MPIPSNVTDDHINLPHPSALAMKGIDYEYKAVHLVKGEQVLTVSNLNY